jgi:D-serine deaminase-like pyridoxal phosphate-dependent protein
MNFHLPDYHIRNIEMVDSPALVIYPALVRQNIALAIRMAGGAERLRPHVKTCKSPAAVQEMMQQGIHKFKCATIAEAEMLGRCGARDVLLAYQPVGPKVRRFLQVVGKFRDTQYACLIDDLGAATRLASAFADKGLTLPVFIDLNLGQNRTGISPSEALALYTACAGMEGIYPAGLHAYDGHIRELDFERRKLACDAAFAPVADLARNIQASGYPAPALIAGGSPSFPAHADRPGVECSPGTFIYWDKGYSDLCPEQAFTPAALLMTRVISLPDSTKICLDLGHKSVAAENELAKRAWFPAVPGLIPISQSEEHLVLEAGAGHGYQPGDVLYAVPFHICPTVALYEKAQVAEDGLVTGDWAAVARDRKLTC